MHNNLKILIIMIVAVAVLFIPPFLDNYYLLTFNSALILAGMAISWAMLSNLGGMTSFGHAAFFGIAAYASTIFVMKLGVPVLLAIPLAGVIASLSAVLMLPIIHLSGPYFALAILAYSQIFHTLAIEMPALTNGSTGITSIPTLPTIFGINFGNWMNSYYVLLVLILVMIGVYALIRRSKTGLALKAISESDDAARVVGVNSIKLKFMILLLSAFIAGIIGAFNTHLFGSINPDDAFSGNWSLLPIIAAIFGGVRTLWGPVIGAILVYGFDQLVAKPIFADVFQTSIGHQIILGIVLAALILFAPNGILPLIFKRKKGKAHA